MRSLRRGVALFGLLLGLPAAAQYGPPPPPPVPPAEPPPTYPPAQPATQPQQPQPQTLPAAQPAPAQPAPASQPPPPEYQQQPQQARNKFNGDLGAGVGALLDDRGAHFMLYFNARQQATFPIWFGGYLTLREWLVADQYLPYNYGGEGAFSLGPRPFKFILIRLQAEHDASLSLFFRGEAATLPCFEGDIDLADNFVLSYQILPLFFMATRYDSKLLTNGASEGDFDRAQPYLGFNFAAAFKARVMLHLKPFPNLHVKAHAEYGRQWSYDDQLVRIAGVVGYGILEDAVLFSVTIRYDLQGVPIPTNTGAPSAFYALLQATLRF